MVINIKESLTPPNVSRETLEKLKLYFETLQKWNKTISLMERISWEEFYDRHILDSLQLADLIEGNFADLGSGAGIPGIPLSILGKNGTLIESNKKKCVFLKYITKLLDLKNCDVTNERIENVNLNSDCIFTSKALTSLTNLLNFLNNVSRETIGVFHKGEKFAEEIKEAEEKWLFKYDLYRSISHENSVIIKVSNIRKRR